MDSLRERWLASDQENPNSTLLDEYGATLTSWLLENLNNQSQVETVLTTHLLENSALLDHCSWEVFPLLYKTSFVNESKTVAELFTKIPLRELVLHTSSAYEGFDEETRLRVALQMVKQFERAITSQSPKRAKIEMMDMVVRSVPTRYVSETTKSVSKGDVYGLESAEDTSAAGQKVPTSTKASLRLFIPPILAQFDLLGANSTPTTLATDLTTRRILASALFRLAHSVASFRPALMPSSASSAVPTPPELAAPSRPMLKDDPDLEFLHKAAQHIADLVGTLCCYSASELLSIPNIISHQRIHAASNAYPHNSTSRIEIPELGDGEMNFDLAGVSASLFEMVRDSATLPDGWLLYSPKTVLEMLLQHAQALVMSRSFSGLNFLEWILGLYPSHTPYDIAYATPFILEQEILPVGVPMAAYQMIKMCIEFGVRMPDPRLRQSVMSSIHRLIKLFNGPGRYKLIYLLLKTCPYPTTHGLLIHLMKEEYLAEYSATDASSAAASPFFNKELLFEFLGKTVLAIKGLESRSDAITAGLNFLRAILLSDSQRQISAIWQNAATFKTSVLAPLSTATLQLINQHMKDDSFEDRQRIRKEISSKGMGDMSVDQLAQSQNQTILAWQLIHSLIQRIEELMPKPSSTGLPIDTPQK